MVTKIIKREDIPDWVYGDVCIKTFSYGEKLTLGGAVTSVNFSSGTPVVNDKDINISDLGITALAAGILYVKNKDNFEFLIKASNTLEEKKKIVYNFEFEAGRKLADEVNELNKPLSDEAKKL